MEQQKPMKYYALHYARNGFAVFPVRGGGKEPLTGNGCKDATRDAGQIERWWGKWPDANVAIATGAASGGLVVIDVDIDEDAGVYGNESLRLWESEFSSLPDTLTALTGRGGAHYYFRADKEVRNRAGVLEGVDVRGEGGYVIAPPSLHPNGRRYVWEASSTREPADITEDLLTLVLTCASGGRQFQMPEQVMEGARNDTLFRLASSLQAKGLSDSAIVQAAYAENQSKCSPPLSDREIQRIVDSVLRYEKGEDREAAAAAALSKAKQTACTNDAAILLSEETLANVYAIRDIVEREDALISLRQRARELKVSRDFNALWTAYKRREVRRKRGDGGNTIQFTDAPVLGLKCGDWRCDDLGVRRFRGGDADEGSWEQACSHPIMPVERLSNVDTGVEKLRIAFSKDGKWRSMVVDRSVAASNQKIVNLADRGVQIISKEGSFLTEYLRDVETLNMDKIPQYRSIGRFGWVEEAGLSAEFSPYAENLKYDGDSGEEEDFFGSVRRAGTREGWLCAMADVRGAAVPARITLAAAFASPLIGPMGKLPFMIHLWGGSGVGKSVSQMVAASIWGNPSVGAYVRSLNNTKVGVETLAAFCSAAPLILDELQTINDEKSRRGNNFDGLVYLLCAGQGRGRGNARGGLRQVGKWRLCTITSGEMPLTSNASGGGVLNRVIEIECKQKLFSSDAPRILEQIQRNYGWGGREWVELISRADVREEGQLAYQSAYEYLISVGKSEKQALAGALCIAADQLATRHIFEDGCALSPQDIEPYLLSELDVDMGGRAYQWILSWLAANPHHFSGTSSFNEVWGEKQDGDGVGSAWIIAQVLRNGLENAGFSFKSCMSALARAGKVEQRDGKTTHPHRIGGSIVRCVHLYPEMDDGFDPEEYETI